MVDCGDNTSTGWEPGTALLARGINALERLIVTNYDEDHASGFANLYRNIAVYGLQRNGNISAQLLHHLNSEDGIGSGVAGLANTFSYYSGPPLPGVVDDITITALCNQPGIPPFGFNDENNLSLCVFISIGVHRIVFPGDMEKAGWKALLANQWFAYQLHGVTLFVASHHGRENGYCEEVLNLCPSIQAIIISDKKKGHQSQETVDRYRGYAKGFVYNGENRHVLTTRRDSNMYFDIPSIWRRCDRAARARRLNRTFDFYEYAAFIIPGAVLTLGVMVFFPEARALFSKEGGVTFGELGIFVIVAYAAGQLIQGIGNFIEAIIYWPFGGKASERALAGKFLSPEQYKKATEALKPTPRSRATSARAAPPSIPPSSA